VVSKLLSFNKLVEFFELMRNQGPAPSAFRYAQMLHLAAGRLKYTQETTDRTTLNDLIRLTPPEVVARSFDVQIINKEYHTGTDDGFKRTHRKFPTIYNEARVWTRSKPGTGSGKQHKTIIRFYGPPKGSTLCWVWCDCDYFKFTVEKSLADQNSSSIKHSNGEKAIVRNPHNLAFLCKHGIKAAQWALSQRKDLASKEMDKLAPPAPAASKLKPSK